MPRHADTASDAGRETARAWVDVDLQALARNARTIRRAAGVPLLAMVKADAYGLGVVPVARALAAVDPWGFGVATVVEGEELRAAGVEQPIVMFTPALAGDFPLLRTARLTPILGTAAAIGAWTASGGGAWHLGVDTGMSRAGVSWRDIGSVAALCAAHPPEGAATHFHSAELGDTTRDEQERRFRQALARLPARPPLAHAENSPALERRGSVWDLARPGVFLYGVGSGVTPGPEPVVHVRARIVELRTLAHGDTVSYDATWRAVGARRIATAALGYADGYRRALSNRGIALVGGKRVPVVGHVTMDMTMLDVTGLRCEAGDIATFIGRDGADTLTVEAVATLGALSPYEVLTSLRARLPRRYADPA